MQSLPQLKTFLSIVSPYTDSTCSAKASQQHNAPTLRVYESHKLAFHSPKTSARAHPNILYSSPSYFNPIQTTLLYSVPLYSALLYLTILLCFIIVQMTRPYSTIVRIYGSNKRNAAHLNPRVLVCRVDRGHCLCARRDYTKSKTSGRTPPNVFQQALCKQYIRVEQILEDKKFTPPLDFTSEEKVVAPCSPYQKQVEWGVLTCSRGENSSVHSKTFQFKTKAIWWLEME